MGFLTVYRIQSCRFFLCLGVTISFQNVQLLNEFVMKLDTQAVCRTGRSLYQCVVTTICRLETGWRPWGEASPTCFGQVVFLTWERKKSTWDDKILAGYKYICMAGYKLDGRGSLPCTDRNFSLLYFATRSVSSRKDTSGSSHGGKTAMMWSWPLTSV